MRAMLQEIEAIQSLRALTKISEEHIKELHAKIDVCLAMALNDIGLQLTLEAELRAVRAKLAVLNMLYPITAD